jgi:CheY-like chemotaxis protein
MPTILLVDDDEIIRRMLRVTMERMGHQVLDARNGREALEVLDANAIDVILMDLMMPEKDGVETIKELRNRKPFPKIIAMSGGGRVKPGALLPVAQHLGACSTLAKPFSNDELNEAINAALKSGE